MPHNLHVQISSALWEALAERSRMSGQTVSHIVQAALAETLDLAHESMYQVSTSAALVEGLYQGCVTVGDLRMHGDVGLGTFEDLDGEMIVIDGRCYQARSDGSVVEADDSALTPFATVVNFAPDRISEFADVDSLADLEGRLNAHRMSDNAMVSFRMTGRFTSVRLRTACKTPSGVSLADATAHQANFDFEDITGSLVGFWSPDYIKSISIPGYHLHFISADRQHGGHVLNLQTLQLQVEINDLNHVHLAVPETDAYLHADLAGDHAAALQVIERERQA